MAGPNNANGKPGNSGRQGVSTVNLNALTADSVQLDYLAKEQQAATELLNIQTQNAEKLSQLRLTLLDKLMEETKRRGEKVETELANSKYTKALEAITKEIEEVRAGYTKLYQEQQVIQQQNRQAIRQAEIQISNFRMANLKLESTQRLKDIATIEQAELASIRKRLALQPNPAVDMKAFEEAEAAVNSTIAGLNQALEEARAEQDAQTTELIKREAELRSEALKVVAQQGGKALQQALEEASSSATSATGQNTVPAANNGAASADVPDLVPEAEQADTSAIEAAEAAELESTQTVLTARQKAEQDLAKMRLQSLSDEHLKNILYTKENQAKYRLSAQELALYKAELAERQQNREADAIAELFTERANQEKQAEQDRQKALNAETKAKISKELEYIKKMNALKGADGNQYSEDFSRKMFTERADVGGGISKTKAEMSVTELKKVQAAEKDATEKKYLEQKEALGKVDEDSLRKQAEEQAKAQTAETGELVDPNTIFEQMLKAEQELNAKKLALLEVEHQKAVADQEEEHKNELAFSEDKEAADKKIRQEESKFAKSKVGTKFKETSEALTMLKDPKAYADSLGNTSKEKSAAMQKMYDQAAAAIGGYITQLNKDGASAAKKRGPIDTNLQGSETNHKTLGSYWESISNQISMGVGVSPFVRQEDIAAKVETLAGMGISYNIKQRAFLDTIKDKIATTFEAADGTLRKLIRVQQADSTAARLGMESALTSFLNSMYETSEFMHEAANEIRGSLYEATALMKAEQAAEYEYQVQKWTGSLFSVGFNSAQKVAETLGKITAGDISGVTEGGMSNLLIMAANEASIPIAEILEKGLTPDQTNRLMRSMVEYLAGIYAETNDSNVLAQQYAQVFGVTASDLKAAANLMNTGLDNIAEENKYAKLSYAGMEKQLKQMSNSMIMRTSTAEFMQNIKDNFNYTMATTIANNPVLSGLNSMANMLNDLVGGIEIPFINVYGFGFDLNATVADLMNVAALSGTVLGGMGKMLASLAGGGGFSGSGMLRMFGVDLKGGAEAIETRGSSGAGTNFTLLGGKTTSESGSIAGNESGDDVKNKTMSDASAGPEKQIAEAKEEQEDKEEARTQLIDGHIVDIFNLLQEVTMGAKKWHVQLDVGNNPASWSTGTWT